MEKPNFIKLCRMHIQQLTNFPFIEQDFDFITNYEFLCLVVDNLNKVIENANTQNDVITQLYNAFVELKNYVDNLDLQDEVNNKLDEMSESGELEELIGRELNKTNGELTLTTIYKNVSEYIKGVSNDEIPMTGYVQGMTITDNTIIIAYQTGGALHDKSNMIFLTEIDKATKTILKQRYLELFHANSIAYNKKDSELYVASTSYRDENYDLQNKNDIIILDYNTFDIKDIIQPSTEITNTNRVRSVMYDNSTDKLYLGDVKDIWEMYDFTNVKKHIVLNEDNINPLTNDTIQNFVVCNNIIYATRTYPTGVNMFDLDGNLLKNYYDLKTDIDTFLLELESIAIEENGDIYLVGTNLSRNDNKAFYNYETVITKSNLKTNGYLTRSYSGLADTNFNLYVDVNTTNTRQSGKQTEPFKTLQQAFNFINYIDKDIQFLINLVGENLQYSCFVTKTSRKIVLNANNNYIYACQIENQDMIINSLKINGTNFVNFAESYPTPIRITNNSSIVFNNLVIENSGDTIENGIYISNSNIDLLGINGSKLNNLVNMENGFVNLKARNITVSNVTNYWKTGQNTNIEFLSNANKSRTNPTSSSLPNSPLLQLVPYTFADNTITFNNLNFDGQTSPYHLFSTKLEFTLNNTKYNTVMFFYDSTNQSCIFSDSNYIYECLIKIVRQSKGVFVLTPAIYQISKADGTITDITESSNVDVKHLFCII